MYASGITVMPEASMLHPVAEAEAARECDGCCRRCGIGECDVKILYCNCCLHARCTPLREATPLRACPVCRRPAQSLTLLPMRFEELDRAQAEAAQTALSEKRGMKRQNATVARLDPERGGAEDAAALTAGAGELRTGRWTPEETAYCDRLIELFEAGALPIPDTIKLNDFLSLILKSKQSRLTKKMKNAKLSSRQYRRHLGYIESIDDATHFSNLESLFFTSIKCNMERSEIRFHMQKVWRELFSAYCVGIGVKLDAEAWLQSVEEIDRRISRQKDAARTARRKMMMGYALSHDSANQPSGVFIDSHINSHHESEAQPGMSRNDSSEALNRGSKRLCSFPEGYGVPPLRPLSYYSSPFIGKIIHYIRKNNLPFEYVDAWVPSQVPSESSHLPEQYNSTNKCRLCFGGSATTEVQVPAERDAHAVSLSDMELFDLNSFGLYSQKFSFDIGCGLPGRVYESGVASWERGVDKAPSDLFERCGGATQWGIQTVLGVPVASPSVGRIVVLFYSRLDRPNDSDLVIRIIEKLTKLMPSPKWKLIVDLGVSVHDEVENSSQNSQLATELLNNLTRIMPLDQRSPFAEYLPGFSSMRLLLTTSSHSDREVSLMNSIIQCYRTYQSAGISDVDATWMTARDCMLPSKQNYIPQSQIPQEVTYANSTDAAVAKNMLRISEQPGQRTTAFQNSHGLAGVQTSTTSGYEAGHGAGTVSGILTMETQTKSGFQHETLQAVEPHTPFNNRIEAITNFAPYEFDAGQQYAYQLSALLQSDPHVRYPGAP